MAKMKLRGPATGNIDVTQGDITVTVPHVEPSEPTGDAIFFGSTKAGGNTNTGLSYTTNGIDAPAGFAKALTPVTWRAETRCEAGTTGNVIVTTRGDDPVTDAFFVGAVAEVYRVTNGDWTHVRTSNITATDLRLPRRLFYVAAGETSAKFKPATWERREHTWDFGIAAIDLTAREWGTESWTTYARDDSAPAGTETYVELDAENLGDITSGGSLAAPANFTATADGTDGNGLINFAWDAVSGAEGYILMATNSTGGTSFSASRTITLEDDGGSAVQEGDHVILRTRIMQPDADTMMSYRVHTAASETTALQGAQNVDLYSDDFTFQWKDFDDDTDPRPHATRVPYSYLRIDHGPLAADTQVLSQFALGRENDRNYWVYRSGDQFKTAFYARSDVGCTLRLSCRNHNFTFTGNDVVVGSTWQWVEITGTADNDAPWESGAVGLVELEVLSGASAGALDFAGGFIRIDGLDLGALPAALSDVVRPGQLLRDHGAIKPGITTMDLNDWSAMPGLSARATNIETLCQQCLESGGNPWFQIEWHHSPDDWLDILAYFAAPVSSGHYMALRRQANGRTAPWADAFDRVVWEFSNEAWNTLAAFWTAPSNMVDSATAESYSNGDAFGMICRNIAQAMQASPYWDGDKMEWFLGGWSGRPSWNDAIIERFYFSGVARTNIGIANYNGGWDEGTALVDIWQDSSLQSLTGAAPITHYDRIDDLVSSVESGASFGWTAYSDLFPAIYEAGPGYQLSGLNGASVTDSEAVRQNKAQATRLGATGVLDSHLYRMARGVPDNIFQLASRDEWGTHQIVPYGDTAQPFAYMALLETLYEEMGGDFLSYLPEVLGQQATVVLKDTNGEDVTTNQGFNYVLRSKANPDRWAFVMGNRSFDTTLETTMLNTVKASATTMRVIENRGDMLQHNRHEAGYQRVAPSLVAADAVATATSIDTEDLCHIVQVGQTFALNSVTYTVATVTQSAKSTTATITFTPALDVDATTGDSMRWDGTAAGDGWVPDVDCVAISYTASAETVPGDLSQITTRATGGTVDALAGGECVIVILE